MSNNPNNSNNPEQANIVSPPHQPQAQQNLSEIINEQAKKPPQQQISHSDLKKAAKQVISNPGKKAEAPKPPEAKQAAKAKTPQKVNMKAVYALAVFLVLLIPLPKQVGGDVEIEASG